MEEKIERRKIEVFSERVRAGKRTYFFDIKSTRANDYYLTITESKRIPKPKGDGFYYEKHKIFLYKEDFDNFVKALTGALAYINDKLLHGVAQHESAAYPEKSQSDTNSDVNVKDKA